MYKCKHCNIEFETCQKLGGHVLMVHKKENIGAIKILEKNRENYEKNPTFCKECGKKIEYDLIRKDKRRVFCGHTCSARNSNKKRAKQIEEGKLPYTRMVEKFCTICGNKLCRGNKIGLCIDCSNKNITENKKDTYIKEWLETKTLPIRDGGKVNKTVREFILNEQDEKCAICGIEQVWNDKPINFIMDHISGDSSDTSRENLRMICPNCDSQTDTYKGKNKGNGRHYRKLRYQEGKSF